MNDNVNGPSSEHENTPPANSHEDYQAGAKTPSNGAANTSNHVAEDNQVLDLEVCVRELAEMKDRYLRTVAEMDNMRKRLEREKQDFLKFSSESILKDMIPVLDSLDKAIPDHAATETTVASYREGIVMVHRQFLQMLAKHGLEAVDAIDKPFDPNVHQAIQRIESKDATSETVVAEFAKGYSLYGRLLRPSMVSVQVPV